MIQSILLSGAGVGFGLFVAARLIPNEKMEAWGADLGKWATTWGVGRFGKKVWEKIETFVEDSGGAFFKGFRRGLDSDDVSGEGE